MEKQKPIKENIKILPELLLIDEVDSIVDLHCRALPDDFFPKFDRRVIKEYYRNSFRYNDGFIMGVKYQNRLLSFVYLSEGRNNFFKLILSPSFPFLLLNLIRVIFESPSLILNLLISLFNGNEYKKYRSQVAYIATDPEFQNKGIGVKILIATSTEAVKRNIHNCFTKTLSKNKHVIKMYSKIFEDSKIEKTFSDYKRNYTIIGWSFKKF
ncbi:MAG: GNAT family N-acetyltransferase [Chitinophagaceae bacterium]|nr:GNAT family N-acetyltransferase [Chitinophagaceae bacterium]